MQVFKLYVQVRRVDNTVTHDLTKYPWHIDKYEVGGVNNQPAHDE
jgi:hypothetical protein